MFLMLWGLVGLVIIVGLIVLVIGVIALVAAEIHALGGESNDQDR